MQPPVFDDLAGGLYEDRNKEGGLLPGDQYLDIQAHSEEGIASIEVIANGDQLVHETTCEQTEAPGIECKTVLSEWVSNTESVPPGHLNIEAMITDRLGGSASERFWVDIPEPPPPPAPGTPIPPKFADVLQFREDYGLEKVFPVASEIERNERIFNLINVWYEGDPVARSSTDKWGVPLRSADIAELEYRERYLAQDGPIIEDWAKASNPGTYAGYFMDHRAGGVLRVGFTAQQGERVDTAKQLQGLIATDRLSGFATQPQYSLQTLASLAGQLPSNLSQSSVATAMVKSGVDVPTNRVQVGATNPNSVQTYLNSTYGVNAPIQVAYAMKPARRLRDRPLDHRLMAGDWISAVDKEGPFRCSLAFGAQERHLQKSNGEMVLQDFALTAGHCGDVGLEFSRVGRKDGGYAKLPFGTIRRSILEGIDGYDADGAAILLEHGFEPPKWIYLEADTKAQKIAGAERSQAGVTLCTSGTTTGTSCGITHDPFVSYEYGRPEWVVQTDAFTDYGDSGGAVWNPVTGRGVGLIVSGPEVTPSETWFTPLRPVMRPDGQVIPGLMDMLDAPGGGSFNIIKAD